MHLTHSSSGIYSASPHPRGTDTVATRKQPSARPSITPGRRFSQAICVLRYTRINDSADFLAASSDSTYNTCSVVLCCPACLSRRMSWAHQSQPHVCSSVLGGLLTCLSIFTSTQSRSFASPAMAISITSITACCLHVVTSR